MAKKAKPENSESGANPKLKRKASAVAEMGKVTETTKKRKKVVATVEEGDAEEPTKKGKKVLNKKQERRKEVTVLYSELINPGRERPAEEIVDEIMETLKERSATMEEFINTKIGSRVVQACLKWGTRKQRQSLLASLKEHLPRLAVNRFGHVVVLKLLTYAMKTARDRKPTEEEKKAQMENLREFLEPFKGKHLHRAFYHKYGCKVINGIYYNEVVSAKQKRKLLHDVAVPQAVALLRPELPGSKTLRQILVAEDLTEDHRKAISSHLREAADKTVDKELLGCDITHFIFQAFCEHASEEQLKDLSEKTMAGAPYLLSSKPGAEALLYMLGVANAKQRKALCRDLKGKFAALANNAVDYVVMIRLACTVDDTVLISKTMLAEMIAELQEICFDKYGRKVLAWFFKPADTRLFSPYEIKCASLPAPTSLKAPDTRRQELVRVLRPPLRKVLMDAPLKAAADENAKDVLLAYISSDWDAELLEALLQSGESEAGQKDLGLLGNTGTATTTIIALLRLEPEKADPPFGLPLWQRCLEPHLQSAVTSRCSFVLLELLKRKGKVQEAVLATLRKRRKEVMAAIDAADKSGIVVKGARKLMEEVDKR